MSNAYAVDFTLVPTATGATTDRNATTGTTSWVASEGASAYALQLHVDAGTATVVLEGCNIADGTIAVVPKVILTATGGATGDFFTETGANLFPYKYIRLRCSAFAAATAKATVLGVR